MVSMISDNNNNNNILEIPVTLRLKKNIAEIARILAICYDGPSKEDFDNFISGEVTQIVVSLAEINPQEDFPDSLKQYVQNLLLLKDEDI